MKDRRHGELNMSPRSHGKIRRRQKKKRICEPTGKTCYTKAEARRMVLSESVPVHSYYRCESCGTYHTSHYKEGEFR